MNDIRYGATRLDLPPARREKMVALLDVQLADAIDLRYQVKQAHWNVKGPHFIALHQLFDQLYTALETPVDDIAERIAALGGTALGTVRAAAKQSRVPELPHDVVDGLRLVALLAERYALVARSTREAIDVAAKADDAATADLFTGVSRELDKSLWFLEAHLV